MNSGTIGKRGDRKCTFSSICATCIYYADFEGICVCGDCEWRADSPPTGLAECGCYERKENGGA